MVRSLSITTASLRAHWPRKRKKDLLTLLFHALRCQGHRDLWPLDGPNVLITQNQASADGKACEETGGGYKRIEKENPETAVSFQNYIRKL